MANGKNEHVFRRESGWSVRREGSKKISKLFENRNDALEYAGIIALNDGGSIVSHKNNGQFKEFNNGNNIHVRRRKIAPIITGTVEIIHPIRNNNEPIVEIRSLN